MEKVRGQTREGKIEIRGLVEFLLDMIFLTSLLDNITSLLSDDCREKRDAKFSLRLEAISNSFDKKRSLLKTKMSNFHKILLTVICCDE